MLHWRETREVGEKNDMQIFGRRRQPVQVIAEIRLGLGSLAASATTSAEWKSDSRFNAAGLACLLPVS